MGDGSTDLVHGDPRVCGDHARGVPRDWGGGGRGHPTGQAEGARTTPNSAAGQNPQPSARSAGPPAGQDPGSSADRAASKARTGNLRRRGVRKDSSGNRAEHSTQRLRQRPRILASQVSRRIADPVGDCVRRVGDRRLSDENGRGLGYRSHSVLSRSADWPARNLRFAAAHAGGRRRGADSPGSARVLAGRLCPHSTTCSGRQPRTSAKEGDGRLDFTRSADELELRIRAFDPWPGSFTTFDGKTVKIHRAELSTGKGAPGEVLRASREGLEVACASGSLVLLEVQPEAKRKMSTSQFL